MKTITIEQLESVNKSLANKIRELGSKLNSGVAGVDSSYWVVVETSADNHMYVIADNGYEISEELEVPVNDYEAILKFIS